MSHYYSGLNIKTRHNFGKYGIYNVTLNVLGPGGNNRLIKSSYLTAVKDLFNHQIEVRDLSNHQRIPIFQKNILEIGFGDGRLQ